jgi:hypothetical protein
LRWPAFDAARSAEIAADVQSGKLKDVIGFP